MNWLILTLISAVSLALCDAFSKHFFRGHAAGEMMLVRMGWTVICLLPAFAMFPLSSFSWEFALIITGMVPLELGATYLFLQAIQGYPLAKTLPYMALTPVFVLVSGAVVLGEVLSFAETMGVVLVAVGTYLLNVNNWKNLRLRTFFEPFLDLLNHRGAQLMVIVAFIYSITAVGTKMLLNYAPPRETGIFYFLYIGTFSVAISFFRNPASLKILWRRPLPNFLIGFTFATMVVTHFLAIENAPIATMIAVKRTSILFGIILGAIFLGEKKLLQSLLAASVMIAGVAVIAMK